MYPVIVILIWSVIIVVLAFLIYKKKWKRLGLFSIVVVLVLNFFPALPVYLWIEPLMQTYHYSAADGEFEFRETTGKGRDLEMMQLQFESFRKNNSNLVQDTTIYRTFRMNPLKVWKWREYLIHPRWNYPYKPIGKKETGGMNNN